MIIINTNVELVSDYFQQEPDDDLFNVWLTAVLTSISTKCKYTYEPSYYEWTGGKYSDFHDGYASREGLFSMAMLTESAGHIIIILSAIVAGDKAVQEYIINLTKGKSK
jgi:hypothetical protein